MENFDHKAWINKVLRSYSNESNVEGEISSVILNLQTMLEVSYQRS